MKNLIDLTELAVLKVSRKLMKLFIMFFLLILPFSVDAQGFRPPEQIPNFPLAEARSSIFKLEIMGPKMYGTAFAIGTDILITNVHNITHCLAQYGLVDTGYDGKHGPLKCNEQGVEKGSSVLPFYLLGSNPRRSNDSHDFAAIQVMNLNAIPIKISLEPLFIGQTSWVIGYPSKTFRSKSKASEKKQFLIKTINEIFKIEQRIMALDAIKLSSQDIYNIYLKYGFMKIQPLVAFSEFLSGALIGSIWEPLFAWKTENSVTYQKNLLNHIDLLKVKTYSLLKLADRAIQNNISVDEDADDTLKASSARVFRISSFGVLNLEGDATPGSSGSAILNSQGMVIGILFQLRTLNEGGSDALCVLDAMLTSFESIKYSYCPQMGPTAVSAIEIDKSLKAWGIAH